jgi:hypothetical protein
MPRVARTLAATVGALALAAGPAHADGCARSRDAILRAGDLPQSAQTYRDLFKMCLEVLTMPNVKDAFILREGAVAVVPRIDRVGLTAPTLAAFCERFPRATLRFVRPDELARAIGITQAVRLPIGSATPCARIRGR